MKYFLDEKGVALPLVLMILFILTLLGTTIFMFNMAETKQVALTEDKMKAHYVARSGAHAVAAYIIENPEKAIDLHYAEKTAQEFRDGEFVVDVRFPADNDGNYTTNEIYIRSTGTVNGSEQDVLAIVRNIGAHFPVFGDTIELQGQNPSANTVITGGNVYYRTENINVPDHIVQDGEVEHLDRTFPPVIMPCDDTGSPFYGTCPPPNTEYDGSIITSTIGFGKNNVYEDIKLVGQVGGDIEIDASHGDNILVKANKIEFQNNDLIVHLNDNIVAIVAEEIDDLVETTITGSGTLAIYCNQFVKKGNLNIDLDNEEVNLNVYVTKDGEFELAGTPNFHGAIYAPEATFFQSGSGSGSLNGWILAGEFRGGQGMVMHYYPYELTHTELDLTFFRIEEWHDLSN